MVDREGDSRVHSSALLEDVPARFVKGEHGGLPNIPAVAQDVWAWLTHDDLGLASNCDGALKGHLSATDETSGAPLLDGSATPSHFLDLPDYENPTPELRSKIAVDLDVGRMPEINLVKIL